MNTKTSENQKSTSKFKQGNWPMILALVGLVAALFVIKMLLGLVI